MSKGFRELAKYLGDALYFQRHWLEAIALQPQQSLSLSKNLGDALAQQGEMEKAIAPCNKAMELKPNH